MTAGATKRPDGARLEVRLFDVAAADVGRGLGPAAIRMVAETGMTRAPPRRRFAPVAVNQRLTIVN